MRFLEYINNNFNRLMKIFRSRMINSNLPFDEDVFSDTILKCHNKLEGKQLTEKEMMGYFWSAFKTNTLRELRYLRNKTTDEIPEMMDEDDSDEYVTEKFNKVSKMIIDKFGKELYSLFAMHANGSSYEELCKKTDIPNLKYQFRKIREYVRSKY